MTDPDLTDRLRNLPAPPAAMATIIQSAGNPAVKLVDLASLIEAEPTFTAQLLGMANAAGGAKVQIRTVRQAAVSLGARTLRNQAVAHVVRVTGRRLQPGDLDVDMFWEDCLRRAVAAKVLAEASGFEDPAEAFTVGLIQDLGTLMLAALYPDRCDGFQEATRLPARQRAKFEHSRFGMYHATLFGRVGQLWRLPDDLCAAVRFHHRPKEIKGDRRLVQLCQIAHAADAVSDVFQASGAGASLLLAQSAVKNLGGRTPIDIEEICASVRAELSVFAAERTLKHHAAARWTSRSVSSTR